MYKLYISAVILLCVGCYQDNQIAANPGDLVTIESGTYGGSTGTVVWSNHKFVDVNIGKTTVRVTRAYLKE